MNASSVRYDSVTRLFHWVMALGFFWMFCSALGHFFWKDASWAKAIWSTHKSVGATLFVLGVLRVVWVLATLSRRPAPVSAAACVGHVGLYVLMLAIPGIGLLRQYHSDRAFEVFGVQVLAAGVERGAPWMNTLGGLLHGELGWVLFAAVLGHVFMVFWHARGAQPVLPRMLGRS
jgi:cytochrome b561